jgi:beta-lactamase regulating signal transducer with metallopeptidase domain/protocatechuate 3,4-dioxygenase beta subunit
MRLDMLLEQPWVARAGWTLVHFLWQGAVLAVLFAAARVFAGRRLTARGRYGLACATLALMAAALPVTFAAASLGAGAAPPVWRIAGAAAWERCLPWLVPVWMAGVLVFSVRLAGGWRVAGRLRSKAVAAAPCECRRAMEELIDRMRVSRAVRLLASSVVMTPTVIGWLRPVILMPADALAALPLERLRALLAHELAHIRRHDYLVNILQSIAEVLLFYHPAVWWVSKQIRTERELCCDDLAVEACGDALVYAFALADLESNRRARLQAVLAADGGSLVYRLRRLAGQSLPLAHTLPGTGAALALGVVWLAGMGAALHGAVSPPVRPSAGAALPRASLGAMLPQPVEKESALTRAIVGPAMAAAAPVRAAAAPLFAALLFDPLVAAPQEASPAAAERKKIRVEGTVLGPSGEPVRKAAVRLQMRNLPAAERSRSFSETTDDSGKFVIDDLPPGIFTLSATKAGFLPGSFGARSPAGQGATITLTEGAVLQNLEIKLTPEGVVAGTVTFEDRQPVANSPVNLLRSTYVRGRKQADMVSRGITDDQGRYTIGNVRPGRYYVVAEPGMRPPDTEPGTAYVETWFPGVLERPAAAEIAVAAGARVEGINVRLRRERVYSVKGKVTLNGQPLARTMLELQNAGAPSPRGRTVGVQDGAFALSLPAGDYELLARRGVVPLPGYTFGLSGGVRFTVKDSNLEGVSIAMQPGVELSGSFRLEGGEWAALYPKADTPAGQAVFLPSVGIEDLVAGAFQAPVRAEPDGAFSLPAAPAGKYLLNITGLPKGMYVKTVRYGVQDVTHAPLDLTPGGGKLEVIVSGNGAALTASVSSDKGEPMSGITVTVWPKQPDSGKVSGGVRLQSTDQAGRVEFDGIAPGEYYAAAWEEIENGLAQSPAFLAGFTGRAAAVKLDERGKASVALKMIPIDSTAGEAAKLP